MSCVHQVIWAYRLCKPIVVVAADRAAVGNFQLDLWQALCQLNVRTLTAAHARCTHNAFILSKAVMVPVVSVSVCVSCRWRPGSWQNCLHRERQPHPSWRKMYCTCFKEGHQKKKTAVWQVMGSSRRPVPLPLLRPTVQPDEIHRLSQSKQLAAYCCWITHQSFLEI